jgi:ribosomal protein L7/L12
MKTFDDWYNENYGWKRDNSFTDVHKENMRIAWNAAVRVILEPTWQELAKDGKYVSAVKLYRQEHGYSLKEAKGKVDSYLNVIKQISIDELKSVLEDIHADVIKNLKNTCERF